MWCALMFMWCTCDTYVMWYPYGVHVIPMWCALIYSCGVHEIPIWCDIYMWCTCDNVKPMWCALIFMWCTCDTHVMCTDIHAVYMWYPCNVYWYSCGVPVIPMWCDVHVIPMWCTCDACVRLTYIILMLFPPNRDSSTEYLRVDDSSEFQDDTTSREDSSVKSSPTAEIKTRGGDVGKLTFNLLQSSWCTCDVLTWGVSSAVKTWKVDPFLYQILPKNETHFYTRAINFMQNLLKMSHYFPKLLKLSSKFGNFGIRLMKLGLFLHHFQKILKIRPCLYQFLHWIRGHRYTRRLILRPISAARPWIDLCTKKPPGCPRDAHVVCM